MAVTGGNAAELPGVICRPDCCRRHEPPYPSPWRLSGGPLKDWRGKVVNKPLYGASCAARVQQSKRLLTGRHFVCESASLESAHADGRLMQCSVGLKPPLLQQANAAVIDLS